MPVRPAALEVLAAAAPVLNQWGRWYLFGAQAVVIYGVPRLSADVDVTVALTPDEPAQLAAAMEAAGFAVRIEDPDFVHRTRVMPFVHRDTGMPLDVVLAGSGLEDDLLDRAVPTDVGGMTVPVVELTDLVTLKLIAGRDKDLQDARALSGLHAQHIDWDRIRTILATVEEALGRSDLLPRLQALIDRT